MPNPRVKKFGTISEQPDGKLLIEGFDIDADGSTEGHEVIIVRAIMARLQKELIDALLAPAVRQALSSQSDTEGKEDA